MTRYVVTENGRRLFESWDRKRASVEYNAFRAKGRNVMFSCVPVAS